MMLIRDKHFGWVQGEFFIWLFKSNGFRFGQLLLAWLFAGLLSSVAYAVPMTTTYQGYLENADGEPLNATVNMTFALYATAQGGSAVWTETHQQIEVTDGVFSVTLGSQNSFTDDSLEDNRYLGVTVGTDPEMTPRQPLTSAFFAMRAGVADSVKAASVETEAIADGAVTADKIATQTITGEQIAAGVTITAEERQKLESLGTGGIDNNPTFDNVTVEEQLNVKKHLKVGENSIHLDSSTKNNASTNEIYTDGGHLVIQPPAKSSKNVGIGTSNPKAKLHVNGVLKLSPVVPDGTELFEISGKNGFKGIWAFYNEGDKEGEISSVDLSYPRSYSPLIINGDDVIINQKQEGDNIQPGNVGIGLKIGNEPKSKLDIAGSVAIGSGYAGKETAPKNGLLVEGDVKIGIHNYPAQLEVGKHTLQKAVIGSAYGPNVIGWGGAYIGFNAKRIIPKKSDNQWDYDANATWVFDGDGGANGGSIIYNDVAGSLRFVTVESTKPQNSNAVYSKNLTDTEISSRLRMTIRGDNGYVGIGTPNPSCKLDVRSGNICRNGIPIKSGFSDKRWKKDIKPLENTLEKVVKLQGVNYQWDTENYPDMGFDDKPQIGLIAQEVEKIIPEVVTTNHEGYKGVDYSKITAVLVEAVKELKAQNDALKAIVCEDHPEKAICQ